MHLSISARRRAVAYCSRKRRALRKWWRATKDRTGRVFFLRLGVALLAVGGGAAADRWLRFDGLTEASHVVRYFALTLISLCAVAWPYWLLLNFIVLGVWTILVGRGLSLTRIRVGVWVAVAALEQFEALVTFGVFVSVGVDPIGLRAGFAVALLALGLPFTETLSTLFAACVGRLAESPAARLRQRAWFVRLVTLGCFAWLYSAAPTLWVTLVPLFLAILSLIVWRSVVHATMARRATPPTTQPPAPPQGDARARQGVVDHGVGKAILENEWIASLVVNVLIVALGLGRLMPIYDSEKADARDRYNRAHLYAVGQAPRPLKEGLALFIVSDSQLHELRGERNGAHLDLVDSLVPVAVRPVELDLLSGAPLRRFAEQYEALRKPFPGLRWIHLGDLGDLGCRSEVERALDYLGERFGFDRSVGLVPGNHDSTFVGNFAWHPSWISACKPVGANGSSDYELRKNESDRLLYERSGRGYVLGPGLWHHRAGQETALVGFVELGRLRGSPVYAILMDTSDDEPGGLGIAGAQGAVSRNQIEQLEELVRASPADGATYIVFAHHPFQSLSSQSRTRVKEFIDRLPGTVAALVTAHTHLAAAREVRPDAELGIPELVVGSTIDPPQEAALLQIGYAEDDSLHLRLATIPTVARPEAICAEAGTTNVVTAEQCRSALGGMSDKPDCKGPVPASFDERAHASCDPNAVRCGQQEPTRKLLACVAPGTHPHGCAKRCGEATDCPLDDSKVQTQLDDAIKAPKERTDLVCLAWAASVLQGHKRQDWLYADALAYAFEKSAAPEAVRFDVDVKKKTVVAKQCADTLEPLVPGDDRHAEK
jgi:hypothetical protein